MAKRIVHQLIDDIDGTTLEVDSGESIQFALDGVAYEIDLSDDNARTFRDAIAPYVDAGRSVSTGPQASAGRRRQRRRPGQPDLLIIRTWARDNGHRVSDRGRIPASVIEAYEAAH